MSRYIPEALRRLVAVRANFRCEYRRLREIDSFFSFQMEHIVSMKHGGLTVAENLALACQICNYSKGSDIATFLNNILTPIRFFNPRIDVWDDHFEADRSGEILPKTAIGEATIKILDMNHFDSVIERREMIRRNIF